MHALHLCTDRLHPCAVYGWGGFAQAEDLGRGIGGDGVAVAELTSWDVFILGASGLSLSMVYVCQRVQIPMLKGMQLPHSPQPKVGNKEKKGSDVEPTMRLGYRHAVWLLGLLCLYKGS